jgi:DNA-binding response OmpR family regulator
MARILIIDDEPDLLEMCALILEGARHSVTTAVGAPGVMQLVAELRPDLVLLDLVMPGMSGEDAFRKVREIEDPRSTPIVVMSASFDGRIRARQLGADGFLAKPFGPPALIKIIDDVLRRAEVEARSGLHRSTAPPSR